MSLQPCRNSATTITLLLHKHRKPYQAYLVPTDPMTPKDILQEVSDSLNGGGCAPLSPSYSSDPH